MAAIAFSGLASVLFLSTLYLQQVRAFTAFRAGLFLTPLALAMMLCAPVSGWLVSKRGTKLSLILAGLAISGGSLISTHLNTTTSAGVLVLSYLCFGIGIGMVNPAISTVAMSGMPPSQSGVAAAIASTSRAIGSALGVAVSGAIVAVGRASGMGFPEATHAVWWTIAGSGVLVATLGWFTNTRWAQDSILRQEP
jgi:MFS family permease